MSKVTRLLGKGEKISFEEDDGKKEFTIKPLKNKELLEIMQLAEKKDTEEMMYKMVFYSLNKDNPDITVEDVKEMPYLFDFLKVIARVNHLEDLFDFQLGGGKQRLDPKSSQQESGKNTSQEVPGRVILQPKT